MGYSRSELYFKAYLGNHQIQKPAMSHIVIYPKDISETMSLSAKILQSKSYQIFNFYELKTKIETILDITKAINIFSVVLFSALTILSILFVCLSLYRSLEKKRAEIGVFPRQWDSKAVFFLDFTPHKWVSILPFTSFFSLGIYKAIEPFYQSDYYPQ